MPAAQRIIEDGKIKAGLVYDRSRLNKSRLSVTWLSANVWNDGSIYGTVEFQFDWKSIVVGQNIYWVEAIKNYKPYAYRFLLAPCEIASDLVQRYDPTKDDGPLRRVGNSWYWNGSFTSEFMVESDLFLYETTGVDFVYHREQHCGLFGLECTDRKTKPSPERTAGRSAAPRAASTRQRGHQAIAHTHGVAFAAIPQA